ncbi:MAG TPA: TetR/AcrR family transcriptional regulator, partial [Spirochaetia bacterium]|nr:TetR/AcrR family transcriptional regulator [Spirochaetia bacterium]
RISKGAFYLFYESKEMLILDAIRMTQNEARESLFSRFSEPNLAPMDIMRMFLQALFDVFEDYPLLRELSRAEVLTELLRGLPQETLAAEQESDEAFFQSVFKKLKDLGALRAVDRKVMTGLPRLILALVLNQDMIGKESFARLKAMVISALARELSG